MKFLGKIEFDVPNKKPRRCRLQSSKVKELQRFKSQKLKMLLKLTNRWRSRSNTFKDIYISLSLEFIVDVKLLFRFLISWLVLELWPKDWTPMSEFSDFWVFFDPPDPHRQKFQNLAGQTLTTTGSEVSRKFGWNRLARIGEFLLNNKKG